MANILVVDDQPDIREALCEHLIRNGMEAVPAANTTEARQILDQGKIDLVVLDIMMPGETGLSLCKSISETSQTPVILLTALADDTDRIIGLEIGADDYVTKPFNPRELLARIRSVLRRSKGSAPAKPDRYASFGTWRLDTQTGELSRSDNVIISLSTGELRLLTVFLENAGHTLSRDDLFNLTKGREGFAFERSLDNMISRLRRKIETDPSNPDYIKTVWGDGYRFIGVNSA
jgi:two-component system OmpR family response regulator